MAFFAQNKAKLCKTWIITLVFEKKRQFFHRKLAKIAESFDHNIDPRLGENLCMYVLIVTNKGLGYILGDSSRFGKI
jgi:hypothetical protein